jgi:hypothetical protein
VYVRYATGDARSETFTDDIVLDERDPTVGAARTAGGKLHVTASDANTGLAKLQVKRSRHGRMVVSRSLARGDSQGRRHLRLGLRLSRHLTRPYVRVIDVAGNASAWRRAKH